MSVGDLHWRKSTKHHLDGITSVPLLSEELASSLMPTMYENTSRPVMENLELTL